MAKATESVVEKVTRTRVPGVLLEITDEEAQALRDVLAKVAGHPDRSRRGLLDSIADALESLGFHWSTDDMTGFVRFEDR